MRIREKILTEVRIIKELWIITGAAEAVANKIIVVLHGKSKLHTSNKV